MQMPTNATVQGPSVRLRSHLARICGWILAVPSDVLHLFYRGVTSFYRRSSHGSRLIERQEHRHEENEEVEGKKEAHQQFQTTDAGESKGSLDEVV
jgi:hypothetical protein